MRSLKELTIVLLFLPVVAAGADPGFRIGPEVRVAPFRVGVANERLAGIIPVDGGYTVYSNTRSMVATPVSLIGVADPGAQRVVGPPGFVVMSAGRPLVIWAADGRVLSTRLTAEGAPEPPVEVTRNQSLIDLTAAECDDSGCAILFRTSSVYAVMTDTEGRPVGGPTSIDAVTNFTPVSRIALDPSGVTVITVGGGIIPQQIERIDRAGDVVYSRQLPAYGQASAIVWAGDHDIFFTTRFDRTNILTAYDISTTGAIGSERVVTTLNFAISAMVARRRGTGFVLAAIGQTHLVAMTDDGTVMTSEIPSSSAVDLATNAQSILAVVAAWPVLFAVRPGSDLPASLIFSRDTISQQPHSIVRAGSDYVAIWGESELGMETLYASRIDSSGAVVQTTVIAQTMPFLLPPAASGTDVLVVWYDQSSTRMDGAIVRLDGSVDLFDLGTDRAALVIGVRDGWVLFSHDAGSWNASNITHSGVVLPGKMIASLAHTIVDADWDGSSILVKMDNETILLAEDLDVVRRVPFPDPFSYGNLVFSRDSYLYADGVRLVHIAPTGDVLDTASIPFGPTVGANAHGWFVTTLTGIAAIANLRPLVVGPIVPIAGVAALTRTGDLRAGILLSRKIDDVTAVIFRELELVDIPRRRSVVSR